MHRRLRAAAGLGLAVLALGAAMAPASSGRKGYTYEQLASIGGPAPGGGTFDYDFEPSALNSSGVVGFTADVTTGGGEGVFTGTPGSLTLVARTGDPAPGGGAFGGVNELGRLGLMPSGNLVFGFALDPFTLPFPSNSGVWRWTAATDTSKPLLLPGWAAPGGGTFLGTYYNTDVNTRGDAIFAGIVTGSDPNPGSPPGVDGAAVGLFGSHGNDHLAAVVRPGDPAPGGGVFDMAVNASINGAGDVAFGGHVVGDPCVDIGVPLLCGESVYLRRAGSAIESIAHQGEPSPCDGRPYLAPYGPHINAHGDIAFIAEFERNPVVSGVFLYHDGSVRALFCPGDAMPGGDHGLTSGASDNLSINGQGQVVFPVTLDSDVDGDGIRDSGLYRWSNGELKLFARTGTTLAGIGVMQGIGTNDAPVGDGPVAFDATGVINARGQILFNPTLAGGLHVLLLATPVK